MARSSSAKNGKNSKNTYRASGSKSSKSSSSGTRHNSSASGSKKRMSRLEQRRAQQQNLIRSVVLAGFGVLFLAIAKALKLDMFTCGVASLANIGGTASAPVLAGTYSGSLVPVGVLMALIGYAVGTPLALVTAQIMKMFA